MVGCGTCERPSPGPRKSEASSQGGGSPRLVYGRGHGPTLRAGMGVAAVVEGSGYADLPLLLRKRLPESSGLPSFFHPGIFLVAKLFLDLDPWAVRPAEDAAKLSDEGVPLLIVHSKDDEVVPFEHAKMLAASYPDVEFWRLEGYGHVEAYFSKYTT
jgi:pimeloyl-ACP methyl ester carboxylesterase